MYPEVRRLLPELERDVLDCYEEHHVADILCLELAAMDASDERFDAKATVLIESVTHHVREEEQDWFPKLRAGLGRNDLAVIGARMLEAKKTAPRSPSQPSALKKVADAILRKNVGPSQPSTGRVVDRRRCTLGERGVGESAGSSHAESAVALGRPGGRASPAPLARDRHYTEGKDRPVER